MLSYVPSTNWTSTIHPPQFHIRNILPRYENIIVPKPIMLALSLFPFANNRIQRHIKMSKNVMKYLNHILSLSYHSVQNSFCDLFRWRIVWRIVNCRNNACFKSIVQFSMFLKLFQKDFASFAESARTITVFFILLNLHVRYHSLYPPSCPLRVL